MTRSVATTSAEKRRSCGACENSRGKRSSWGSSARLQIAGHRLWTGGGLPHTARAALTGLRKRGYDVHLVRGDRETERGEPDRTKNGRVHQQCARGAEHRRGVNPKSDERAAQSGHDAEKGAEKGEQSFAAGLNRASSGRTSSAVSGASPQRRSSASSQPAGSV